MSDALNSRPFDQQMAALLVESHLADWQQEPAERCPILSHFRPPALHELQCSPR